MDHKLFLVTKLLFSILTLHFLASPSFAYHRQPPKRLVPPETICKFTPYPSSCKSLLPNKIANVYDYTRFSVLKSLSQTFQFQRLVNRYLQRRSFLSQTEITALEDCQFLTGLNIDYLMSSLGTINVTSGALPTWKTEDVQTLLSAILTNQQTCWDGLQSASSMRVRNGLSVPVANDTKLYSLSLALFTNGWVPKKDFTGHFNQRKLNERFPFPVWSLIRRGLLYESLTERKMLQTEDGQSQSKVLIRDVVTVSLDGTGNFTTINDAVAAAPNNSAASKGYFVVYVKAGVYEEYVSIEKKKKYLMMIGDGINQTIITGNRSVVDGWTTFKSATFAVVGPGFVAMNITFRNTAGASKHQAVAVRNGADLSAFYRCSFEGYQDTLYTHSLRQFYRECDIYGTVDFIFGNAAVVFQNCNLYARLPMTGQFNAITAQGRTDPNQNTGTSIHNCTIKAAEDLASSNGGAKTYLGRPWKEYSRTVYMQSYMDSVVDPVGWREWNGDYALSTLYYAEHNNTGPGSDTEKRVTWPGYHAINASDAATFAASSFLLADNWVPQTGVVYTNGLP
ncbi:putative pectinesterase/pectinesterase inhibitor 7 [Morus notabilis]|uniref:Pectinesterase n=1 Tax=Morus notabilis TaxID=981085 RepID=W9QML8_9ROSA|nr:probable pectinesterase/pectinesterase inhibitor 7 [Morus notabilis]EXB33527.1 putative pectinesterase/pectinesterase inhibitor 7 [Morus notabilis]